jgi:hypothetical protein
MQVAAVVPFLLLILLAVAALFVCFGKRGENRYPQPLTKLLQQCRIVVYRGRHNAKQQHACFICDLTKQSSMFSNDNIKGRLLWLLLCLQQLQGRFWSVDTLNVNKKNQIFDG